MIRVLQAGDIRISQVIYHSCPVDTSPWNSFAAAVSADGLTLEAAQFPQVFTWGTMQAQMLNPAPGLSNPNQNDASLVIRLHHGSINYLNTVNQVFLPFVFRSEQMASEPSRLPPDPS